MQIENKKFDDIKNKFFTEDKYDLIDELRYYEEDYILAVKFFNAYEDLLNNFSGVMETVAGFIQNELRRKDYSNNLRWNIYTIFVLKEEFSEKYLEDIQKIENDKYSCKKYVINAKDKNELEEKLKDKIPYFFDISVFDGKNSSEEPEFEKPNLSNSLLTYLAKKNLSYNDFANETIDDDIISLIYGENTDEN